MIRAEREISMLLICPFCGTTFRAPREASTASCPRCKTALDTVTGLEREQQPVAAGDRA